jgi:hypothetical protein
MIKITQVRVWVAAKKTGMKSGTRKTYRFVHLVKNFNRNNMRGIFLIGTIVFISLQVQSQQKDTYCRVCTQKIDRTNDSINGIPHQLYEQIKVSATDAILNYKAWFSHPGTTRADFLTPDSKDQRGDVRHYDYLQWRDLLHIPDSIKKNMLWCLDIEITRCKLAPDILFQVRRKYPYRLVELYNWGRKLDTFYLPVKDSLNQFDSLFLFYARIKEGRLVMLQGVSGNIEIESSRNLELPFNYLKNPLYVFWSRLVQFGVDGPDRIFLLKDTVDKGKYRLYSTFNSLKSSVGDGLMERGAIVKGTNKAPFDNYYEFIFFSNDKIYTGDPDKKNFYEVKRIFDFTKEGNSAEQDGNIYPSSYEDTRWHLKKLGTRKEADDYCRAAYGVGMWSYMAGEDAKLKRP